MTEHPVLFNSDMVRAILNGTKCQTRRPIKLDFLPGYNPEWTGYRPVFEYGKFFLAGSNGEPATKEIKSPFGSVGDVLWVRETARLIDCLDLETCEILTQTNSYCKARFRYEADGTETGWVKYPERLKPLRVGQCVPNGCFRELARIFLMNDEIKVERVQEISEEDAICEGITPSIVGEDLDYLRYRAGFQTLWNSIYKKQGLGWEANPYVFSAKVRRVEAV